MRSMYGRPFSMNRSRRMSTERSAVYDCEPHRSLRRRVDKRTFGIEQRRTLRPPQQLVAEIVDARIGQHDHRDRLRRRRPDSDRWQALARRDTERTSQPRDRRQGSPMTRASNCERLALEMRRPAKLLDIACAARVSSHTVCQMPVVRGYQIECGSSCQSCLPRGFVKSCGSSSTYTVTVCLPDSSSKVGDVGPKRCVSAFVRDRETTIDPNAR